MTESRKTILLVEDEIIIAAAQQSSLTKKGYEVIITNSGEEAVEVFSKTPEIDMVLMDIDLGKKMNGTEAASAIIGQRPVPVIFLSSHSEPEIVEKTEKITSYGYVMKNSSITVLDISIKMAFRLFETTEILEKELAERKRLEEILEKRMLKLTRPLEQMDSVNFGDLFSPETLQKLQDEFSAATDVSSIITLTDGTEVTEPSNFTEICRTVRKNKKGMMNCRKLDKVMESELLDRPVVQTCKSCGLWTAGAAIMIGKKHAANWLIGQIRNETQTDESIASYAREIGENEHEMLESFKKVPYMSQEKFSKIADFLYTIANQLSSAAFQNIQQACLISDLESSERKLNESSMLLENLMEHSPSFIYILDVDGRFMTANRKLESLLKVSSGELVGRSREDFFPREVAEKHRQNDLLVIDSKNPIMFEEMNIENNEQHYYLSEKFPILDRTGEVYAIAGISTDITERKKLEEKLIKSETLLNEAQRMAHTGNWVLDFSDNSLTWSDEIFRIFEIDRQSFGASYEAFLNTIHPDDREDVDRAYTSSLENKTPYTIEHRLLFGNGRIKYVHEKCETSFDENGKPLVSIGTVQDISDRKFTEIREITARNEAEKTKDSIALAISAAKAGTFTLDIPNDRLEWDARSMEIFGVSPGTFENNYKSWAETVHPDDLGSLQEEVNRQFTSSDIVDLRYRILRNKNQVRYIWAVADIQRDENSNPVRISGLHFDITESTLAQKEIKQNETRLRSLVEILQSERESQSAEEFLDYALEKTIELTSSQFGYIFFYNEETKEFTVNSWSKNALENCTIKSPQTVYQLDQTGLWGEVIRQRRPIVVNDFLAPNPLKKGFPQGHAELKKFLTIPVFREEKIVGVAGVANKNSNYDETDILHMQILMDAAWKIANRKQAEYQLSRSTKKFTALFETMTEMTAIHDIIFDEKGNAVNYRITDCNPAFTAITGIKKEDAVGKTATEVYQCETAPYLQEFCEVGITGISKEMQTFYEPMDKHFIISIVSPAKNSFATITTDITAVMQIQKVISEKNRELENYLYIASHDLRSPLVNIQGFSQRLQNQTESIRKILADADLNDGTKTSLDVLFRESIPKSINFIFSNVTKMDNLIKGLLQISRTGRIKMTIRQIDMNRMIHEILEAHNFQISEISAIVITDELLSCYGDENQINQLFSNLIDNALKYHDKNRKFILHISSSMQYNKIIYSINDTGIGIEPQNLEKIWDVFFRVDPENSAGGEGIGLSLARRITDKHKGRIWAGSEPGKGSTFFVELQKNSFTEI